MRGVRAASLSEILNKEKRFARVAAVSRVSHPTLSARIKQLEEDMDVLIVKPRPKVEGFTREADVCWRGKISGVADINGDRGPGALGADDAAGRDGCGPN